MSHHDANQQPKRLPLWKWFVHESGEAFEVGTFFPVEKMEEALGCLRDGVEFAFAISNVRKALRRKGKHWTSRGQAGKGWIVVAPQVNTQEVERLQRASITAMREGVILGTNTPTETLADDDRRRHEALVERMAVRLVLITRRNPATFLPANAKAMRLKKGKAA